IAANKDTTQKFANGFVEGFVRGKQDKQLYIDLAKKYLKDRGSDPKAMDATYEFDTTDLWRIPPLTTPDLFKDALDPLATQPPKAKGFDINTIIDNSYIETAAKTLGKA